ncbi:orotidine-5'-phosphate decarboxylase [Salinibacterium hongtaonis]|uniref:Orotidine-5'-phosphate decarboxylase n=1 Tax=Homoserinimonas hongtaonis TaxID=2079791 RepID=A0A2U1SYM0_9MICO|nr:orotidine-5'-phosphate decarboxylase [Salinibacterium hongtaonis]
MRRSVQSGSRLSTRFGTRLEDAVERTGRLCVGIDPHPYLLSSWGLSDTAEGIRDFSFRVLDAAQGAAGIIKPQVAFFERHGSAGYAVLEDLLAAARSAGILVIADAKRGDVGTSVEAYGQAWLTPGSPLEADAMTVSAFQGVGSLDAVLALAESSGKGVFVLAATSNPESALIQQAKTSAGTSVSSQIIGELGAWNTTQQTAPDQWGSAGVVLGATVALGDYGVSPRDLENMPILAPGFGHQGAQLSDLRALFGDASRSVLVSASRSILSAGPDGVAGAIAAHSEEIRAAASKASGA